MTIASAAAAALPALPATAHAHSSAGHSDESGDRFSEQLNGAMANQPSAGAWRSPAAAKPTTTKSQSPSEPAKNAVRDRKGSEPKRDRKEALAGDPGTAVQPVPVPVPLDPLLNLGTAPVELDTAAVEAITPDAAMPAPMPLPADFASTRILTPKPLTPPGDADDSAEPAAPGSITAAAGSPQSSKDLAFAARVQPVQSVAHSALPAEMASAAAVAAASKKVTQHQEEDTTAPAADTHASQAQMPAVAAAPTLGHAAPAAPQSTNTVHAAPATGHVEAPAPIAENTPKLSTTALKDISLQVTQPGQERVDVRVVQQGSEVHVSVHSGDATLTSGLRQGLSDLQSRLEENGYRSEMWRPGAATAPVAANPETQGSTNHSRGGDPQPQHQGGSQHDGGRRNQNQSNQPRWVEELDASLSGNSKPLGGSLGISN